jgi:hypothetical protein
MYTYKNWPSDTLLQDLITYGSKSLLICRFYSWLSEPPKTFPVSAGHCRKKGQLLQNVYVQLKIKLPKVARSIPEGFPHGINHHGNQHSNSKISTDL